MIVIDKKHIQETNIKNCIFQIKENNSFEISYDSDVIVTEFLYYVETQYEIKFSHDFFEIVNSIPKPTLNMDACNVYTHSGYTPYNFTIYNEIHKIPSVCKLNFIDDKLFLSLGLIKPKDKISSKDLIYNSIRDSYCSRKKNAILFSGGYDSILTALILKKEFGKDNLKLITIAYDNIDFMPVKLDLEYSKKIAKELDLEHEIVLYDPKKDNIQNRFNTILLNNPLSVHFSFLFSYLSEFYSSSDYNFISGQNADSIINLGATSQIRITKNLKLEGIGEALRRFFYIVKPDYGRVLFGLLNFSNKADNSFTTTPISGFRKFPFPNKSILHQSFKNLKVKFDSSFRNNKRVNQYILNHLLSFIQGGDNAVMLTYFKNSNNQLLPFANLKLVTHYLFKQNVSFKNVIYGKYDVISMFNDLASYNLRKILSEKPNTPNIAGDIIWEKIIDNESDFIKNSKINDSSFFGKIKVTNKGSNFYLFCLKKLIHLKK